MSSRRLFLAIPLSNPWKGYLLEWIAKQPNYFPWIPMQNWHITVQFLGDIRTEDIEPMCEELAEICQTLPEFFLNFMTICPFRSMIWAKVKQSSQFETLVQHCAQTTNLYMSDQADKRKPKPHITLARLRGDYDLSALKFPDSKPPVSVLHVSQIELWESDLQPHGAKYRCLREFKLQSS